MSHVSFLFAYHNFLLIFCSRCFIVSEYHKQPAGTPALSFDKVSLDEKLNIYNDLCKPLPLYAHLQLQVNLLPTFIHPSTCSFVFDHSDFCSSQYLLFCFFDHFMFFFSFRFDFSAYFRPGYLPCSPSLP